MILNGEEVTEITISRADGYLYNLLDLKREDMPIEHIAWNLAHINRYGGAQPEPVSVALHSILVSYLVNDALAYEALMHDATEAFVGDMMHPIKAQCPSFRALEAEVRRQLVPLYSLPRVESSAVKAADMRARDLECVCRRGFPTDDTFQSTLREYRVCEFLLLVRFTPAQVAEMFLARYQDTRALAQNWS